MALKYVSKSIVVDAEAWTGDEDVMERFLGELFLIVDTDERLRVDNSKHGFTWASLGDMVVKYPDGDYDVYLADEFVANFERV